MSNPIDDALSLLTVEERSELNFVQPLYEDILRKKFESLGVTDLSPLFAYLLMEFVEMSAGDKSKDPAYFRKILKYHFKTEGEHFYIVLVGIFAELFERFQDHHMPIVKMAALITTMTMINEVPSDLVKITDGQIYFRRVRTIS